MSNPEFSVGDVVTYAPYGKPLRCTVRAVKWGMFGTGKHYDGTRDGRTFYTLSGEANSVTSGSSIIESSLYSVK